MRKVLLQDKQTKRYYAGPDQWVEDPSQAFAFPEVSAAAKAFTEEDLVDAEIVILDGSLPTAAHSAICPPPTMPAPTPRGGR